jgi:hypothetical protein
MRSFFGRSQQADNAEASAGGAQRAGTFTSAFASFFGRGRNQASEQDVNVNESSHKADVEGIMLRSAAQTLTESIEIILSESDSLSGDHLSGFISLMRILDCEDLEIHALDRSSFDDEGFTPSKTDSHTSHSGEGCIQILLNNMEHPEFVDTCTNHHVAVSLVQALRLLKIFEIKVAKKETEDAAVAERRQTGASEPSAASNNLSADLAEECLRGDVQAAITTRAERAAARRARDADFYSLPGASRKSSGRACRLLCALCAEPETWDLLHKNKALEKLLMFPLSALPEKALHLQVDVAGVISAMCATVMPSEHVWLVHDQNIIPLMTRSLKELCAPIESTKLVTKLNGDLRVAAAPSPAVASEALTPVIARRGSVRSRNSKFSKASQPSSGKESTKESAEDQDQDDEHSGAATEADTSTLSRESAKSASDVRAASDSASASASLNTSSSSSSVSLSSTSTATTATSGSASNNRILRGEIAEQAGMWITGANVLIDVICASMSVNAVLMNDFEYSGGYKLMVYILQHSSQKNCTQALMAITRLLTDPFHATEDALSFPTVGAVILEVLVGVLHLTEPIDKEDAADMSKFIRIAQGIVSALREGKIPSGWEVLIQNVAYVLLTLYSSHPRNCIMLEESYQFLSILLLCVPSMSSQDSVAAVLTTLHFVCHSIPDATTLPLVAATAALGVCVNLGINMSDLSVSSLQSLPTSPMGIGPAYTQGAGVASGVTAEAGASEVAKDAIKAFSYLPAGFASNVLATLDAILQSFDSIATIKSKYALQILRGGLLHSVVCPVFENLGLYLTQESSKELRSGELVSLPIIAQDKALIYVLLVELLLDLTEKSPQGAEEIRHSGLNVILRNLIRAEQSSIELMRHFLRLPEGLAACETTHLEEAMQTIFDVLHQLNALNSSPGAYERDVVYQNSTCEKIKALLFSLYSILEKTDDAVWVWKKFKGFHAITETISGLKPYFASVVGGKPPAVKTPTEILATSALEAALECVSLELSLVELDQHERNRDARHKALILADSILSSGIIASSCASDCIDLITSLMCGFSAVIEAAAKENNDANIACPEMSLVFLRILAQLDDELALKALKAVERHARSRFDGYQQLADCGFVSYALEHHGNILCAGCSAPESGSTRLGVASSLLRMIHAIMSDYLTLPDFAAYLKYFVRPALVHNASRDSADGGNYKLLLPHESYQNEDERSGGATKAVLDHFFELSSNYAKATLPHSPSFVSLGCGASNEKYEAAYLDMRVPDLNRLMPAGNTTFMCWLRCADSRPGKTKASLATNFHTQSTQMPKTTGTPSKSVSVGAYAGSQVSLPPPTVGAQSDRTFASLGVLSVQDTGTFIPVATFTAHPRGCFFEVLLHVRSSRVFVYCKAPNNFRAMIFKPKRKLTEGKWAHLAVSVKKTRRFMGTSKSFVSVFLNGEECENMSSDAENASCVDFDIPQATKDGPLACQISLGKSLLAMSAAESSHGMFIAEHGDQLPNISSGYVNRWQLGPVLMYDSALPHAQLAYIYLSGPDYSGTQGSTGTHDLPVSETLTSLSTTILERCKNADGTVSSFVSGLSFEGVEFVVEPLMEKCSFSVLSVPIPQIPTAVLDYNARNSVCLHVTPSFIADAISRHKNVSANLSDGPAHSKNSGLEASPVATLRGPRTAQDAGAAAAASALEAKLPPRPTTPSKISRGYFAHVERAKRVSQAKLNAIQATKLTLLNSVSMDNAQPLAICVHGWHSSFSESYSSCISALGGPSVLYPLLQVASNEDVLCKVLMLLRCSVLHNPTNLKIMQNGGYEEVAFIMACKPRSLLTPQVLSLLFMFSTNEDIFSSGKLSPKTRGQGQSSDAKDALPSQRSSSIAGLNSGLLLVDTVSLHSFTMNHWVWNVTNFDLVMGVLANLTDLVDDYVYGTLNSHRLSALGAA